MVWAIRGQLEPRRGLPPPFPESAVFPLLDARETPSAAEGLSGVMSTASHWQSHFHMGIHFRGSSARVLDVTPWPQTHHAMGVPGLERKRTGLLSPES